MSELRNRVTALSPAQRALLSRRLQQQSVTQPGATTDAGIAVLSVACRLPGGVHSPEQFWQLLVDGVDAVSEVPSDRWDGPALFTTDPDEPRRMNSRWGGFLGGVDRFDAAFFGISPREASLMDPQQRLLLETAWEALEAGGQVTDRLAGSATGVFIGAHSQSSDYYLLQLAQSSGMEGHASTGSAHSILANRISYAFDLRGPSMCIDTACSSSLVAIHAACQSLRTGESDLAFAGGVNLMLLPPASLAFAKLGILSSTGRCRTFDAAADGIVRGEGCGLVLLKRLPDALRDGDPVLAVIRGSAVNQDGASNGLTAPNGPSQEAVVRRALETAGIAPERVGLVETHGTGTALGDPIEVEALARVIGPARSVEHRCWLGAVKTNLGHLEAAAGIAGLIKAVLCLRHRRIPPNLHFSELNPHISFAGTPLAIPTSTVDWDGGAAPRVAAVSSFGFGGTNAHVVLEEHTLAAARPDEETPDMERLLAVSARSAPALASLVAAYRDHLRVLPSDELADFVQSATVRRAHHEHRLAVVGRNASALADRLEARLDELPGPVAGDAGLPVFVYTGQGTQWAGMGRELLHTEPVFRRAVESVASELNSLVGWDLLARLEDPEAEAHLAATEIAQPVIFAIQVGLTALWKSWGLRPGAVIGHSVGEVAAAHAAGVLTLPDAVRVVVHRSRSMRSSRGQGGMAQVELPAIALQDELAAYGDLLSIAAQNAPSSTVISGRPDVLAQLLQHLETGGVAVRALPVEYAFHSAQMDASVAPIVDALAGLKPSPVELPLVSTVTGRWSEPGDFDAAYWGRNVRLTVRFAPAISRLIDAGFHLFLEVGPHPALGASILACAGEKGVDVTIAASLRRGQPARATLLSGLATLYEAGTEIDWSAQVDRRRHCVPLPAYPWQRQRHGLDPPDPGALVFNVTGRELVVGGTPAEATSCYEMQWHTAPVDSRRPSLLALRLDALSDSLQALGVSMPVATAMQQDGAVLNAVEMRAIKYALGALRDLGLAQHAGERLHPETGTTAGVLPRHERLWRRLLQMLAGHGLLRADGAGFVVTERGAGAVPDAPPYTGARIEEVLLDRCGRALASVLRGEIDPLPLLFPADGHESAASIFSESPSARLYNRLASEAIAQAARASSGRPLRVLEIGAGNGSATRDLLPALPPGSSYCCTNVSPLFLEEAQARFAGEPVELAFRRLDIEQPPSMQGFAAGAFDIVVAANVLHATADLRRTLGHARTLLAPGGMLVLIEAVARRGWSDLTFGLTEDWWRFTDTDARSEDAVMGSEQWQALLTETGFDETRTVGEAWSRHGLHPQVLLLARAAPAREPSARMNGHTWLVLGDQGGIGACLADAIRTEGGSCEYLDADSVAERDAPAWHATVQRMHALHGARWSGIVHCGALDAPMAEGTRLETLDDAVAAGVMPALHVAQALAALSGHGSPRLWLVTKGAQHVAPSDRVHSPAQATLWGLGRTMALEQAQAWGGAIDLDPHFTTQDSAAALLDELCAAGTEDQVALRDGGRRVVRLVQRTTPRPSRLVLGTDTSTLVTGGYGGLGPKVALWLADHDAASIVLLGRSGLPDEAIWDHLPADHPAAATVAAIRALRARGVTVRTERGDVTDRNAMAALFASCKAAGRPIRSVVHAAAEIRFEALASLTLPKIKAALRAKVHGSWVLHELTRDEPLDMFVLFSSGAGIFGAKGLAAYGAANQFLDALACHRAAQGLPVTCVDWGAWSEIRALDREVGGEPRQLGGFRRMDDKRAFEILEGLVGERVPQCLVADLDWTEVSQAYQAHGARPFLEGLVVPEPPVPTDVTSAAAHLPALRAELAALVPSERRQRMAQIVRRELARVLKLAGPEALDDTKGFFDLGLDSLLAVRMLRRLSALVSQPLPTTVTFNYPTVATLAGYLLEQLALGAPPALPASGAEPALDDVADSDVRALLMAELQSLPEALRMDCGRPGNSR
jgi:acyl transferase domain-containing protein/SAM-dependent methyltransferase